MRDGTATPLEIVYTAMMGVALITTIINLAWAHQRVREVKRSGTNGVVLALRRGARTDQLFLLIVCVCLVVIGGIALLIPSNPSLNPGLTFISGISFLFMSMTILALSITIRLRPARLRGLVNGDYPKQ